MFQAILKTSTCCVVNNTKQSSIRILLLNLRPIVTRQVSSHSQIRPTLRRLDAHRRLRAAPNNSITLLINPKLIISLPIARLGDLPGHPRHAKAIEHVDMVLQILRLVRARRAELLEQDQFVGCERVLERNGGFGCELRNAAVAVNVDDVERGAGPVLGDVAVWELVAAA
jgi:hypothetical protein